MKTCPYCAEEIQDAAIVCKHCGRDLVVQQPNYQPQPLASVHTDTKPRKKVSSGTRKAILLLVAIAIVLGGIYYVTNYVGNCAPQLVKDSIAKFQDLQIRWADAISVASSTSRISLSGPVSDMQKLYREAQKLQVAPCLQQAKTYLESSMMWTLEGFDRFASNDDDTKIQSAMDEAERALDNYLEELFRIQKCAPNC